MGDSLTHAFDLKARPLLDLIDNLRGLGIEQDLGIPQIAVCGDQSSGKSSVLEALSGVSFPRGVGLVTKCATELRMKRTPAGSQWKARVSLSASWAHEQPEEVGEATSMSNIGDKITKLTDALLKQRGDAQFEPEHSIIVELEAPDAHDLTVIDLPGIVRTTTVGQSEEVIAQVEALLQRYMEQERTVILAVIECTRDIATGDVLTRSEKADPMGLRTIGVLTKPDLIPEGNEQQFKDALNNISKPLKLGYLMVKNRTQKQIDEGVKLAEVRKDELEFFAKHKYFGVGVDPVLCGIDNLAKRLTDVLVTRIRDYLPQMRREVSQQLRETRKKLTVLGEWTPANDADAERIVQRLVAEIGEFISQAEDGSYRNAKIFADPATPKQQLEKLMMMARIRNDAQVKFRDQINALKPSTNEEATDEETGIVTKAGAWSVDKLKREIQISRGRELPGMLKPEVLTRLMHAVVVGWKEPALMMIEDVADIVYAVSVDIVRRCLPQYMALRQHLELSLRRIVDDRVEKCRDELSSSLHQEELPHTINHYFMDTLNKIRLGTFKKRLDTLPCDNRGMVSKQAVIGVYSESLGGDRSNEDQEAADLQAMLEAYWKTAVKRFADVHCGLVDRCVVRDIGRTLSREGLDSGSWSGMAMGLLDEDHTVVEERKRLAAKEERLNQARKLMDEVRNV